MPTRHVLRRDGTELSVLESGEGASSILLLHGLAGHGGEWVDTAARLADRHRVVVPDARGHGLSETSPEDLSPAALVADATFVIDELALAPVVVIGQSFGGTIAMLLAADRPRLVRGLVLVEAGPDAADEQEISEVAEYLNGWPLPFANRHEAERFFGGSTLHAKRWTDGLRDCPDGLRPGFEPDVAIAAFRQAAHRSYWEEWSEIAGPILVVSAGDGMVPAAELDRMASSNRNASFRRIEDAGHDLHLDAVDAWASILEEFVSTCPWRAS